MQDPTLKFIQMLPPAMVITVLLYACFIFYRHYVIPAKSLASTLKRVLETVNTMRDASPESRKLGLQRVFKGTFLQDNWIDFSRTLHEQKSLINGEIRILRHRSTVPASYFFTTATVIDQPLKVNYFKHLPGILTGLGIIGTFAGLLFGLSNFDASSPELINQSVSLLLGGVRDAFYASAFAITAAMLVTHVEKLCYQRCLTNLENLNNSISSMFEGGVSEEYLAQMASTVIDPAQQTEQMCKTISEAFEPIIEALERNQKTIAEKISSAITSALESSNGKLAMQIENSLHRKTKEPIENLSKQMMLLRPVKSESDTQQEAIRKIINSAKAQTSENPSEAA
jgi:hypothetical protein